MKKLCILLPLMLILLLALTGCGNAEDAAIEAFIKAEGGYNADIRNAVEKYGSVCVRSVLEYDDGSSWSEDVYINADSIVVDNSEAEDYLRYEDEWYCCNYDEDGSLFYSKYIAYDEEYDLDLQYTNPGFVFDSEEDYDITLAENKDGSFVWTSSFPLWDDAGEETGTSTVYLNSSYEITKIETVFYLEDETTFATEEYSYGVENEQPIAALAEALEKTDGQTRHLTYNAVENGAITETFEAEVPMGFYCTAMLPMEYYDEEGNLSMYTDIDLTKELTSTDPNADLDIYFSAAD